MKGVIIVGDGMADEAVEALDNKTPLMAAKTPNLDNIARKGRVGRFVSIPEGMPKTSDVAHLNILGFDPAATHPGVAVMEAAGMGVELGPEDVALRCNLISVENRRIKKHSAGHIEPGEVEPLLEALRDELEGDGEHPLSLHRGASYRHLVVLRGGWAVPDVQCAPPQDAVNDKVVDRLPTPANDSKGAKVTAERLVQVYQRSWAVLSEHPINEERVKRGLDRADALWPWSPGRRVSLKTFAERLGVRAAAISAAGFVKGLGVMTGMDVFEVPGVSDLRDVSYEGQAEVALRALEDHELVYVHVEGAGEAGLARDVESKVRCIEMLDRQVVGPILEAIEKRGDTVLSVLPDHSTLVETGRDDDASVPMAIWRPGEAGDHTERFDERVSWKGSLGAVRGDGFLKLALGRE